MLSWIERRADILKQTGIIGEEKAQALNSEAKRRSDNGEWFGHIAFASILARRTALNRTFSCLTAYNFIKMMKSQAET